jgi:molybdopterin synthase sulfur carrier subunit
MGTIWIPALMRDLTDGQAQITVPGHTLSEVIDALEDASPGIRDRLCQKGKLNPAIQALVDGRVALRGLSEPVAEHSEVVFVPVVAGG